MPIVERPIRQSRYINNLAEQGYWVIKRRTQPMLGGKTFRCAWILLASIEVILAHDRPYEEGYVSVKPV